MLTENPILSSESPEDSARTPNLIRSFAGCLSNAENFARLTIVVVIVGVIISCLTAWLVDSRVTETLVAEVTQRAVDQVQLGIDPHVTASDFQTPPNQSSLDQLGERLDPVYARLRDNGVIRLNLIAPDGTIVYSDRPGIRGRQIGQDRALLGQVLAGSAVKQISNLSDTEDADLKPRFDGALEVYVPVVVDGKVVGAYEVYQDLAPVRQTSRLIWVAVVGIVIPMFLALFIIGRGATTRIRRQMEERERLLQRASEADALRASSRAKSDLLGAVSHELRTPLSIVHGYSELLAARTDEYSPRQVREFAAEINRGSTLMAYIVDDLVDFSRIEHGRLRLETREMDLVAVVRSTVDVFRHQEGANRIVLHCPPTLALTADPVRVRQIIANLMMNALRYAPSGPIEITVALCPDAEAAMVEVRDHGPGISPEALPHIWDLFYRAPEALKSPISGTGIGLALVKSLVEAHGGWVEVESEPHAGATFRVWFPLRCDARLSATTSTTLVARHVPPGPLAQAVGA